MGKKVVTLGALIFLTGAIILAADVVDEQKKDQTNEQKKEQSNSAKAEETKKPAPPAIEFGFEERVRTENMNNQLDYSNQSKDTLHQWRFRTKIWVKVPLNPHFEFFIQLNDESRKISTPDKPMKLDEIVFENLYLDFKFNRHASLRLGRQNIQRGEGFILVEGDPGDGSRTTYVNAVDFTYAFNSKSKVELMGISDPPRDIYLPKFNNKYRQLSEYFEKAFGVYYNEQRLPKTDFQAYYFYKTESGDYRSPTSYQYQPDRRVNTLGARVVQKLGQGWSVAGEFAGQWGSQDPAADIRAWGGYAYVKKNLDLAWKPVLTFGVWGMSGDDPSSPGRNENWDPLFSRYPKWSELYIYSMPVEKGIAYWTNLKMYQAELTLNPIKQLNIRNTYYHLGAFHPFAGPLTVFSSGTRRGDLFESRTDYTISSSWRGHIVFEKLFPGDFYKGTDPSYFFRVEVIYTFKKSFPFKGIGT